MELARRQSLLERTKGAALLDVPTYEEVEADTAATPQAALVVGLVAVASAVAQAPGILFVFALVPVLGGLVVLIAVVWMLVAGIIGIRQALDFGTGRAILTALLGFIPYIIAMAAVSAALNQPGRTL